MMISWAGWECGSVIKKIFQPALRMLYYHHYTYILRLLSDYFQYSKNKITTNYLKKFCCNLTLTQRSHPLAIAVVRPRYPRVR